MPDEDLYVLPAALVCTALRDIRSRVINTQNKQATVDMDVSCSEQLRDNRKLICSSKSEVTTSSILHFDPCVPQAASSGPPR